MLTIGTISGLLTKFHNEIKKITVFMVKNVLVGPPNWMLLTIRSLYGQSLINLAQ